MEPSTMTQNQKKEEPLVTQEQIQHQNQSLPKASFMGSKLQLTNFQGFWCPPSLNLINVLNFQTHFQARDTDLIVASLPKTGTTWLKSLIFAIVNRAQEHKTNNLSLTSLTSHNPHELVYRLENGIYGEAFDYPLPHQLDDLPSPRLLHTHLPYTSLPQSITSSKCKILYISRNFMDTIVSHWHFYPKVIKKQLGEDFEPPCIEDFSDDCCQGKLPYGPFFDHVLGYWKESLDRPNKVLFLKYEDLKEDAMLQLKKMAEFVGMPFSPQEESDGVIKEIIEMCSIDKLRNLEVNKSGVMNKFFEKKSYFRKGEVGGWTNHITPDMAKRISKLEEEKLKGTSLSFKLLP